MARANDLMALSRERIAAELLRLLVARHAVDVVTVMVANGIFVPVLPEIDATGCERLARVAGFERDAGLPPDPIRRLAAMLPRDPAIGEAVGARLKLSNQQRRRLVSALEEWRGAPHVGAYRLGREMATDRWLLSATAPMDAVTGTRDIQSWDIPVLPLTGGALVEAGVRKGPDVARLLREIEEQWIAENFPDQARVAQLAAEAVAGWRLSTRN